MKKFKKLMSALIACAMLLAIAIPVASVAADDPVPITVETVNANPGDTKVEVKLFITTGWQGADFEFTFDASKLTYKSFTLNDALTQQSGAGEPNIYVVNKENAASGTVLISFASAVVVDGVEGYYNVDEDDNVYDYFGTFKFDVATDAEGLQPISVKLNKFVDANGDVAYTTTDGGIQLPGGEEPPVACEHEWDEGEVTTEPTCTEAGEKTFTCTKCGETKTEPVDALGHDWGEWEVTREATATEDGEKTRTCNRCGDIDTEVIPATGEEPPVGGGVQIVVETVEASAGDTKVEVKLFIGTGWQGADFEFTFDASKLTYKSFTLNDALTQQSGAGEPNIYVVNKENAASGTVLISFASAVVVDGVEGYYNVDEDGNVYDYFGTFKFDVAADAEGLQPISVKLNKFVDAAGDVAYTTTDGGIQIPGEGECEHEWNDGEVTVQPTCTEAGTIVYTCSKCGETREETVDALGHDWGEWEVVTPATCSAEGQQKRTCARCGEEETEAIPVDPEAHDWVEIGRTDATCVAEGSIQYACSIDPDHTKEEKIDIDPDAHDWGEWVTVTEPTETEDGLKERTCNLCGEKQTEVIPATGGGGEEPCEHEWDDGVVTTAPTCTEAGEKTFTCSKCGETKTEPVDALGHDYVAAVTEPTCEAAGYTTYTCSRCGDTYTGDEVAALGHSYGEPTYSWSDDNSTCTATAICSRDASHVETETVTATSETTPATTEADGKTVYTATFTKDIFKTQTKEVTIPKLTPEEPSKPTVTGVEDGQTFDLGKGEKPAPKWEPSDAPATLDDGTGAKPWTSGTAIDKPGTYTLTITGADGTTTTVTFTVKDSTPAEEPDTPVNPDQPNTSDLPVAGIAIIALIASAAVVVLARKKRLAK